jgi:hypothetical protein
MRCTMIGLSLGLFVACAGRVAGADATSGFASPANWEGLKQFWTFKDGEIIGSTYPEGGKFNTFLCSKRKYGDFELSFQVRMKGQDWNGNSGVQIRSKLVKPNTFTVAGPQADMGDNYWGSLYGELFGGMMKQADSTAVNKVLKTHDFNDYSIKCVGKHVTIQVNGVTTVDDDFSKMPAEGIIAWQLHAGGPMDVTFRNIRFKEMSKASSR